MFKVSKIGLLNFWNYDEEEYEFYDGKLLLRGSNGSGKSVTMQSFIPLIYSILCSSLPAHTSALLSLQPYPLHPALCSFHAFCPILCMIVI